jgi:hypothetical protein
MSPPDNRDLEILIAEATTAWRPHAPTGETRAHPAWADLDEAGRVAVYEATTILRRLEAARDSRGLSTTARRVLARLGGAR